MALGGGSDCRGPMVTHGCAEEETRTQASKPSGRDTRATDASHEKSRTQIFANERGFTLPRLQVCNTPIYRCSCWRCRWAFKCAPGPDRSCFNLHCTCWPLGEYCGCYFSTWRSALIESLTFRSARRARALHSTARLGHSHVQPNKFWGVPGFDFFASLCDAHVALWVNGCAKPPMEVLRKEASPAVGDSKSDPRLHGAIWQAVASSLPGHDHRPQLQCTRSIAPSIRLASFWCQAKSSARVRRR